MLTIRAAGGRHEGRAAVHVKHRTHREGGVSSLSQHVPFSHIFITPSSEDIYFMDNRKHPPFHHVFSILLRMPLQIKQISQRSTGFIRIFTPVNEYKCILIILARLLEDVWPEPDVWDNTDFSPLQKPNIQQQTDGRTRAAPLRSRQLNNDCLGNSVVTWLRFIALSSRNRWVFEPGFLIRVKPGQSYTTRLIPPE